MDRIAEIARASKRTVYNHFEGKEGLFKAVTERFLREVTALQAIDYEPGADLAAQLTPCGPRRRATATGPRLPPCMQPVPTRGSKPSESRA